MAELYERIEKMCKDKGVTVTEMCKQSGASRGSLTDLKKGRIAGLSLETLEKLMKYFDVSLPELLGTETKKAPSEDGASDDVVFKFFRSLPLEQQRGILLALGAPAEVLAALGQQDTQE